MRKDSTMSRIGTCDLLGCRSDTGVRVDRTTVLLTSQDQGCVRITRLPRLFWRTASIWYIAVDTLSERKGVDVSGRAAWFERFCLGDSGTLDGRAGWERGLL